MTSYWYQKRKRVLSYLSLYLAKYTSERASITSGAPEPEATFAVALIKAFFAQPVGMHDKDTQTGPDPESDEGILGYSHKACVPCIDLCHGGWRVL